MPIASPAPRIIRSFNLPPEKDIAPIVSRFIAAAVSFAGRTLPQLAKDTEISLQYLSCYVVEGRRPQIAGKGIQLHTLVRITHACGVNLAIAVAPASKRRDKAYFVFAHEASFENHAKNSGDIFKALRMATGMRSQRFSDYLGVSPTLVSLREHGKGGRGPSLPRLPTLVDIAHRSGCRLSLALCQRDIS